MKIEDLDIDFHGLCARYGVRKVEVFGSFARGDTKATSDIDLIVEFTDAANLVDRYFDFKGELERLSQRSVDILPNKPIRNPIVARNVAKDRRVIYG
jgi:uncharacterized protein